MGAPGRAADTDAGTGREVSVMPSVSTTMPARHGDRSSVEHLPFV